MEQSWLEVESTQFNSKMIYFLNEQNVMSHKKKQQKKRIYLIIYLTKIDKRMWAAQWRSG